MPVLVTDAAHPAKAAVVDRSFEVVKLFDVQLGVEP